MSAHPRGSAAPFRSCVYVGQVVHKRLRPKPHALAYRVFAACLDVDEIDRLAVELPGFSRNSRNWLSFYDADHGAADGKTVAAHVRSVLRERGLAGSEQVQLLCYPRMLGYAFNPLSVYFCSDSDARVRTIIYEVNNTFGERTSYVIPVPDAPGVDGDAIIDQACAKAMAVSPYTAGAGTYGFRVRAPGERVLVGVSFRDSGGPVIKTHFGGTREPLVAGSVRRLLTRYPLMTLKVIGGIHWEAARLFAKGVPLIKRNKAPAFAIASARPVISEPPHVV